MRKKRKPERSQWGPSPAIERRRLVPKGATTSEFIDSIDTVVEQWDRTYLLRVQGSLAALGRERMQRLTYPDEISRKEVERDKAEALELLEGLRAAQLDVNEP